MAESNNNMSAPTKLNLGCGEDIREGFYNIDIRSLPGVDQVANACSLPTIASNSIEFIVAQHLLEYIPRKRMVMGLKEWKRVLKLGGVMELRVTDLAELTKDLYMNTRSGEMGIHQEMALALIYGQQDNPHDIRFNGFTQQFIEGVLTGLGFTIDNYVREEYDLIVTVVKE